MMAMIVPVNLVVVVVEARVPNLDLTNPSFFVGKLVRTNNNEPLCTWTVLHDGAA